MVDILLKWGSGYGGGAAGQRGSRGLGEQSVRHRHLNLHGTNEDLEQQLDRFQRSIEAYPVGNCPLSLQLSMIHNSKVQSCGKCVPCRDGLVQLERLTEQILHGEADDSTVQELTELATFVRDASDCAIGYEAGAFVLDGMRLFADDVRSHVHERRCEPDLRPTIPCMSLCPAHVDIPGYISLIGEKDYEGAVQIIRKNNPLPTACALICEHPCEDRCRRTLIDNPLNIRGLKEFAVQQAPTHTLPVPVRNADTGRSVAIVGGGPAGLTAAWFLALMGHKAVIFDQNPELGGMLRYGIPNYRFPKTGLDSDIKGILAVGNIEVRSNVAIGRDFELDQLYSEYDAVFVAIGAQGGKLLKMEGIEARGVLSAVDMLHDLAEGVFPNYTGKRVVVIGGGNVAMDCTRTAIRCGAEEVKIVYRRRRDDMTALPAEIEGAVEEGAELIQLMAPVRIEVDDEGHCTGLMVQPQRIGPHDNAGRPRPLKANKPEERIDADIILVAVGQDIVSLPFEEFGLPAQWNQFITDKHTAVTEKPGFFAGGDCVSGPSTVIKAIGAGQTAAYNIDRYLGYHHKVHVDVSAPPAKPNNRVPTGRVEVAERPAKIRKLDFDWVELPMSEEEALQEADRCLRCDHFGCGSQVGGRI